MTILPLTYAPNPIFKLKSEPVIVNDITRKLMDDLIETVYYHHAFGIAAPMVGILKQVIAIDLQLDNKKDPILMANPEIIWSSPEKQTFTEGSLCFPGIATEVERPKEITVQYLDYNGNSLQLKADGFLATCLQHEIDYLHGITFLDYVSKVKKDILLRKMKKFMANPTHHHHEHSAFCNH